MQIEASIVEPAVLAPAIKHKKENLKQRAYLNSLSGVIDFVGIQVTGFIINPFIVRGLGSSMYGIWQMLGQMTGYAKMADSRATQVLKWSLANKRQIAEPEEMRSDVTTALIVTLISMPIALIFGTLISWYAPVITHADAKYHDLIRITCSILILCLIINKVFDLFESILSGMNLGYKRMGLRAGIVVFGGLLKVLAITYGYGLIGLSLIQVIISVITGSTFYFIVKKQIGWFGFGKTDLSKIKSFGKLSGWFMAFTTLKMMLLSSDRILLGYIAGPILVSQYSLTMFTSTAVQGAIVTVVTGMTPGICGLFGKKEYEKVRKARKLLVNLAWFFTATVGCTVLLVNRSFIYLWVGKEHYAGNLENLLILLVSVQVIFFQIDSFIINATLNMNKKVFLSALATAATVVLAAFLIRYYGIIGLCISILLGRMFYTIGFSTLLMKQIRDSASMLTFPRLRAFLVSIGFFLFSFLVSDQILFKSWTSLASLSLLIFLVFAVGFWVLAFNREMKQEIRSLVKNIRFLKINNE